MSWGEVFRGLFKGDGEQKKRGSRSGPAAGRWLPQQSADDKRKNDEKKKKIKLTARAVALEHDHERDRRVVALLELGAGL